MLYITRRPIGVGNQEIINEWHVGEALPVAVIKGLGTVIEIQASGDELNCIERTFTNIPMVKGARAVTWRGEMARFIVEHLPRIYSKE